MFFNAVDDEMRKLFITDKDKHDILLWIIYQTNYQETYKDLKLHQCYISLRTLSEQTKVEYAKTQRIVNKLLKDGYISYVFKSKSRHKPSIIQCNFIEAKTGLKHQEVVSQASEKPKPSNKSTNNKKQVTGANKKPKKTTWSDHYEEQHWQRYSEDELESKLLKAQKTQKEKERKELLEDEGLSEKLGYIDAFFSLSNSGLTRDFTDTELEYLASYTIYQVDFVLNSLEAEKIEPKEFLEKLEEVKMKGVS